jgi:hypothetical protein
VYAKAKVLEAATVAGEPAKRNDSVRR